MAIIYKDQNKSKQVGTIKLESPCKVTSWNRTQGEFMFEVQEKGDKGSSQYYIAANEEGRKKWLSAFEDHNTAVERPWAEGFLTKQSSSSLRWCVLLETRFLAYKKRGDNDPSDYVSLPMGSELYVDRKVSDGPLYFTLAECGDENSKEVCFFSDKRSTEQAWMEKLRTLMYTKRVRMNPNSVREGYLWKASSNMSNWRKRFFILMNDRLLYYRKRSDKKEAGTIPLPGGFVVKAVDGEYPHMFHLAENDDATGTRTYGIAARSGAERKVWIDTLRKLGAAKSSKIFSTSVIEGYLWKCSSNMQNWAYRYFVVLDENPTAKCLYFKKKKDKEPAGTISLPGGFEVEFAEDPKNEREWLFFIAENWDDSSRKYYVMASSSEERNTWVKSLRQLRAEKRNRGFPENGERAADSLHEGYLLKQGGKVSSKWQKRYCVLTKGQLTYYETKNAKNSKGSIAVGPSAGTILQETGGADAFSLQTSTGKSKTYQFKCRSRQDKSVWAAFLKYTMTGCQGVKPEKPKDPVLGSKKLGKSSLSNLSLNTSPTGEQKDTYSLTMSTPKHMQNPAGASPAQTPRGM